jgi:hypothetical protein
MYFDAFNVSVILNIEDVFWVLHVIKYYGMHVII